MTETKEAPKPAKVEGAKTGPKVEVQTSGPFDSLIGMTDLKVGEFGWLSLDDAGKPVGLYRYPPEPGSNVNACKVMITDGSSGEGILTTTGASLTDHMQPNSDHRVFPAEAAVAEATGPKAETKK